MLLSLSFVSFHFILLYCYFFLKMCVCGWGSVFYSGFWRQYLQVLNSCGRIEIIIIIDMTDNFFYILL